MSNNKFESLLELLINEENDKAEAIFHEIVVEKSRDIYENLADEEVTAEAKMDKKDDKKVEVKETEASDEAKVEETAEEKVEETTEEAKDEKVEETSEESKDEQVDEVVELEDVISRKDSLVNALKNRISPALLGFEGDGLTITQKNGKVYISLDEQLLFASGSWKVDVRGKEALSKLSKALENQTDINVMIEGHTDSIPFGGRGQVKDNWDLSVMRATSVVKRLTSNSNFKKSD